MASIGSYRRGSAEISLLKPQFASQYRLRNRTLESKFSQSTWVYEVGSLCLAKFFTRNVPIGVSIEAFGIQLPLRNRPRRLHSRLKEVGDI